jgi:hypothetical protein
MALSLSDLNRKKKEVVEIEERPLEVVLPVPPEPISSDLQKKVKRPWQSFLQGENDQNRQLAKKAAVSAKAREDFTPPILPELPKVEAQEVLSSPALNPAIPESYQEKTSFFDFLFFLFFG